MEFMTITIKDETFAGQVLHQVLLEFQTQTVTVKEIIEKRVTTEVEAYNQKMPDYFRGLIEPTEAEKTLNGYKLKHNKRRIDAEQQVYTALDAFQKNGFFMLIDNFQAESLEQLIELQPSTTISFIKLTPLVGG
ncbi:hypothetical protein [Fluviicola sp.]|uniref:hypothetical protein n=1 Tax=Fluviicola sp. TaxID=1917219 RepID=UPI0031D07E0C